MIQRSRRLMMKSLKVVDLGCVLLSLALVAGLLGRELEFSKLLDMRVALYDVSAAILFFAGWHVILCCHKLYVSRRLSSIEEEVNDVFLATSVGTVFLFLFARTLFQSRMLTWTFLLMFWLNLTALLVLSRLALRFLLKRLRRRGMDARNLVIAGTHERAVHFADEVLERPEFGYHLIGFIDDAGTSPPDFGRRDYKLVCDIDTFPSFLRDNVVDEVMICLPIKSHYEQAALLAATCEEHGVVVRFLSDIFMPKMARSSIQRFEGHPIVTFYTGHMVGAGVVVKRGMDFCISLLLLVVLSPLFLVAALFIKATSTGPVFFVQKRMGLNKRHFPLYKFRTMYPDAEQRQAELEQFNEVQGAAFKIKNDPRVTPIGRILRKSSIDELPQLVNVLKGEMSLVGPRPLPIRDYQGFNKDWHRRRFSVRPGITCLWQISGRSDISFDRWMELDMEYIDNWSVWLDIKILLGTIPAVLKGSGAV